MSDTILLYVCRHGQTSLNGGKGGQDCFRGRVDVPLDKQGMKDACELAYYFEPIDLSFVAHSDRKRAEQTASKIAGAKDLEPHATPNLRAWNVGKFSGKPKNDENVAAVEYYVDHPDERIPEGESLNEFKARVRPAILEAIHASNHAGEPGLLVAHSSIIHEISDMLHGDHEAQLVEPGGVVAIHTGRNGLKSEAIFKPKKAPGRKADTVS